MHREKNSLPCLFTECGKVASDGRDHTGYFPHFLGDVLGFRIDLEEFSALVMQHLIRKTKTEALLSLLSTTALINLKK